MYHLLFGGVRVSVRNGGGCVEVSPNVRKSAKLRAIEISRVGSAGITGDRSLIERRGVADTLVTLLNLCC